MDEGQGSIGSNCKSEISDFRQADSIRQAESVGVNRIAVLYVPIVPCVSGVSFEYQKPLVL